MTSEQATGDEAGLPEGCALHFHHFDEFDAAVLYDVLKLRFDVFILEQESLYPELDGADRRALHAVVTDGRGAPVGTARVLNLDKDDAPLVIGRVAIRADHRGGGLGGALLRLVLDRLDGIAPGRVIRLGAQKHLEAFYARFGFRRISDVYDDGGIPHVDMERT